jgi:hypothetical protein
MEECGTSYEDGLLACGVFFVGIDMGAVTSRDGPLVVDESEGRV